MSESKYGKYIITEHLTDEEIVRRGRTPAKREAGVPFAQRLIYLGENLDQNAFNMSIVMFEPGTKPLDNWAKVHEHEYDEILGFVGTDLQNPKELGGEVEIWLEDEKFILTKSFVVYVPKKLKHCPLSIKRVDRPFIHFHVVSGASVYTST